MVNRIPSRQVHVGNFENVNDEDLESLNYEQRVIETDVEESDDQTYISSNPVEGGVEGEFIERNTYLHKGRPPQFDYKELAYEFEEVSESPFARSNQMVQHVNMNRDQPETSEAKPSVADLRIDFNLRQASVTLLLNSGKKVSSVVKLDDLNDWLKKTSQVGRNH